MVNDHRHRDGRQDNAERRIDHADRIAFTLPAPGPATGRRPAGTLRRVVIDLFHHELVHPS
jgi:hypothetical protein